MPEAEKEEEEDDTCVREDCALHALPQRSGPVWLLNRKGTHTTHKTNSQKLQEPPRVNPGRKEVSKTEKSVGTPVIGYSGRDTHLDRNELQSFQSSSSLFPRNNQQHENCPNQRRRQPPITVRAVSQVLARTALQKSVAHQT